MGGFQFNNTEKHNRLRRQPQQPGGRGADAIEVNLRLEIVGLWLRLWPYIMPRSSKSLSWLV